jgi:hypothetical protein
MEMVKTTMIGAVMFGRMWRPMILRSDAPIVRAADT